MFVSRAIWSASCGLGLLFAVGCAVIPAEERRIAAAPEVEGLAEIGHPDHVAAIQVDRQGHYYLIAPDGAEVWPVDPQDEVSVLHPESIDEIGREGRTPVPVRPGRVPQPLLPE